MSKTDNSTRKPGEHHRRVAALTALHKAQIIKVSCQLDLRATFNVQHEEGAE